MDLSRNRIRTLWNALAMYQELQDLDLSGNVVHDLGSHHFEAQHKLVILNLSGNQLQTLGPAALAGE